MKIDAKSFVKGKVVAEATGQSGGDAPTGTIDIISNGIHNVKKYAEAHVQVPGPSGTKQVTISDIGTISENVANYAEAEITTSGLVKPSGNKSITVDTPGTISDIDVRGFATASVTTEGLGPAPSGKKQITENGTDIDVAQYEKVDVAVPMPTITPSPLDWDNAVSLSGLTTYTTQVAGVLFNFDTIAFSGGGTSNGFIFTINNNVIARVAKGNTTYIRQGYLLNLPLGSGVTLATTYSGGFPDIKFVPFANQSNLPPIPDYTNMRRIYNETYEIPGDGILIGSGNTSNNSLNGMSMAEGFNPEATRWFYVSAGDEVIAGNYSYQYSGIYFVPYDGSVL